MGMFDTIQVAKDNIFGLPFDPSGFQTQTLDSKGHIFNLSVDGKLTHVDDSNDINPKSVECYRQGFAVGDTKRIIDGNYTGAICFYANVPGDDTGRLLEYGSYFINNQLVYLELYGDLMYVSDKERTKEFEKLMMDDFDRPSCIVPARQYIYSTKHLVE
jgi:hypothetical protein